MGLRRKLLASLPVRLLRKSHLQYDEDGIATDHAAPFLTDPRFRKAYAAGAATGSWGAADIRWRTHVVLWAANAVRELDGDFVECGVNRGGLSRAVVEQLDWGTMPKTFYLLDTFQGFDPRYPPQELEHWDYEDSYEAVCRTFAPFSNVTIIRGPVPDTLDQVAADRIAFLHIDMNAVVPERAALEFFWPKLVPGGILLLDDYGHRGHEVQQRAHDEFAHQNGFEVLALPTGQGMAIKSRT